MHAGPGNMKTPGEVHNKGEDGRRGEGIIDAHGGYPLNHESH